MIVTFFWSYAYDSAGSDSSPSMGTYKNFRLHSSGISWPTAKLRIRIQGGVAGPSRCHPAVSRPSHAVSGHHAARAGITKTLHCVFPILCKNERLVVTARCLVQRYKHQKCSKAKEVTYMVRCSARPSASLRRYFTSAERIECEKQTARCRVFIKSRGEMRIWLNVEFRAEALEHNTLLHNFYSLTLCRRNYFFLILAHLVYKMWKYRNQTS